MSADTLTTTVHTELTADLVDQMWTLYYETFEHLRTVAVQRHLMHRTEFEDVAADKRVDKYVVHAGDDPVAMATITTDLDAVPLIEPGYFKHHLPEQYRRNRIWYVSFVMVRRGPGHPPAATFGNLITRMAEDGPGSVPDGVCGMDYCGYNEDVLHLPRAAKLLLQRRFPRLDAEPVDRQVFWLYWPAGKP
jgi:hypothetical protein